MNLYEQQRSVLARYCKEKSLRRKTYEPREQTVPVPISYAVIGEEPYDTRMEMSGLCKYWDVYSQQWWSAWCWMFEQSEIQEYTQYLVDAGLLVPTKWMGKELAEKRDYYNVKGVDFWE